MLYQICLLYTSFYLFPNISNYYNTKGIDSFNIVDSGTFCEYLLKFFNIACTPGKAFGQDNNIRICYSMDMTLLDESIDQLCECFLSIKY